MERITVEITKVIGEKWYKRGEQIQVLNKVQYWGNEPHFTKHENSHGIPLDCCRVLSKCEIIPEYTMSELKDKIGHEFKIKGA